MVRQIDVVPVAPQTWSDWIEALTAMLAPLNLLSNLCRGIVTIKQGGTEHPGESVDQYALRISSIFTQLLAESQRTTPSNKPPDCFAWERLKIAIFENEFLPSIRIEQIREDPAHTFASARDRARKHAHVKYFHLVNATNLSSVVSTSSPSLKHHKRGHSKSEREQG